VNALVEKYTCNEIVCTV